MGRILSLMKHQMELTLRLPEELLRKLIYISDAEGRSPNNHLLLLLRNNVQYFERTKGRIPPAALQALSLPQAGNAHAAPDAGASPADSAAAPGERNESQRAADPPGSENRA